MNHAFVCRKGVLDIFFQFIMRRSAIFILVFLSNLSAFAQKELIGKYDPETKQFISDEKGIIVQKFYGNRAAFMVTGKDPFNYNSNRVGFIDTTGKIVVKPIYTNSSNFYDSRALVEDTTRQIGMINEAGEIIIPIRSQNIILCENGLFILSMMHSDPENLEKSKGISLVDRNNHTIVPFGRYSENATPPPLYYEYDEFIRSQHFMWEPLRFSQQKHFNNYLGVKRGNKWAVINAKGKEIILPKFDGTGIFSNNFVPVKLGKQYGLAHVSGKIVIPALYDYIDSKGKDYVYVYKGKKVGLVSLSNKLIIPVAYHEIRPFSVGFTAVGNDGKTVLFTADGKQITTQNYPKINFPYWGQKKGSFYVYNSNTKRFCPYQDIFEVQSTYQNIKRLIFYSRNKLWGMMDSAGREITPPLYEEFDSKNLYLSDKYINLITVKKGNQWGVIDNDGKLLISIIYDRLLPYRGKLYGQKNGKYVLFDSNLKQIIPFKYDSLVVTYPADLNNPKEENSFISVRINNKWGLLNHKGKEIISCQYDEQLLVYHNLAVVKNEGKFGVTNLQGKLTTDCIAYMMTSVIIISKAVLFIEEIF